MRTRANNEESEVRIERARTITKRTNGITGPQCGLIGPQYGDVRLWAEIRSKSKNQSRHSFAKKFEGIRKDSEGTCGNSAATQGHRPAQVRKARTRHNRIRTGRNAQFRIFK